VKETFKQNWIPITRVFDACDFLCEQLYLSISM